MTVKEKGTYVKILDKEFRIACSKPQEASLIEAASYVDEHMQHIRNNAKVVGFEKIAVMAALSISHELVLLKQSLSPLDDALSQRLEKLCQQIEHSLNHALID